MENSSPPDMRFIPGEVLAGKYRIERVLGQGGMGVVLAVQHVQLEQRMALKLMLPQAAGSAEAVARFLREARAAARITSEHVVRVFDVGSLPTGEPYIAMEYLEGVDVSELIARRGRLPPQQAVEYLLQACEALAEAHAAGIVHRDLKPANLFLAQRIDGQQLVKVLDFGISKVTGAAFQSNAPATRTSALMGSPLYMSPEQMGSSKAVDARSDIWALGVVLYEMLAGEPPFNGETLPQVCARVMTEEPVPLAQRVPALPSALYEVVGRCLQKQPAARYQNIADVGQALFALASARGRQSIERISRVHGSVPSSSAAAAADNGTVALSEHTAAVALSQPEPGTYAPMAGTNPAGTSRIRAAPVIGAGVLAVGALIGGAWLVQRSSGPSAAASAAERASPASAHETPATSVQSASEAAASAGLAPSEPAAVASEVTLPSSSAPSVTPQDLPAQAARPRPSQQRPAPAAKLSVKSTAAPAAEAKPAAAAPAPSPPVATPVATPTRSRL